MGILYVLSTDGMTQVSKGAIRETSSFNTVEQDNVLSATGILLISLISGCVARLMNQCVRPHRLDVAAIRVDVFNGTQALVCPYLQYFR